MLPHDSRNPFVQNPWKLFRNASSETIPPFSVMRITGAENTDQPEHAIRFIVEKPNDDFKTHYLINGPTRVPAGTDGFATTLAQAGYVAYNGSDGVPSISDIEWGAKQNQWTLAKYRPGFHICGGTKTSAGVTTVVARQRVVTDLIGKADSTISQGSAAGTVSIYMGAANSEAATEYDIEAYARFIQIDADWWCSVGLRNGAWYAVPLVCEVVS
jgi:hypothetical protein